MEPDCPADSDEIGQREDEILNIFVDICSLFQREPEVNHRASGEEPSAEAYLFSYLRMLETRGRRTPAGLCQRARNARWLITACKRWIARRNWKRACSGSTNRTSAWSSKSPRFWASSNGVCGAFQTLSPQAEDPFGRSSTG
jgi:hypothetical protein